MSLDIPVVDLQDIASAAPEARERATEAIRVGFGRYGLVFVRGHEVDLARRDALYRSFLAFTAEDEAEKRALSGDQIWFQRGYTPPNTERAVVAGGQPDFKECYFCAPLPLDETCRIQYPEVFADNIWPDGMPSFREDYLALGRELHAAGELLLRGCAAALDLAPETFGDAVRGGAHVSRLLRYLPVTDDQIAAGVLWGEEHTDFNLLTILPGGRFLDPEGAFCENPDPESGLYLRTRADEEAPAGHKVRGVPPPGCLVAQVGQQLEILTGGAYLATPHVITAPRPPGYSRISAAHFVHLHPHRIVFPLEPFRNEETVAAYSPPVLAGTYGLKTLVDIGLAPPTALDKLGYRHYQRLQQLRAH